MTPTTTLQVGQDVHWTGLAGKFDKVVTIIRHRAATLTILGNGGPVYDIYDPTVGLIYGIPAAQLHAQEDPR